MILYSNYDAVHGTLPIKDEWIQRAQRFLGWQPSYNLWPLASGTHDNIPSHQAFHIRYLAAEMLRRGAWIGPKIIAYTCGCCQDGNHRLRAVQFLAPIVLIEWSLQIAPGPCWKRERCPALREPATA